MSIIGCGINPARCFRPALKHSDMEDHWVISADSWRFASEIPLIHFADLFYSRCTGWASVWWYSSSFYLWFPSLRMQNFSTRRSVLLNSPEDENDACESNSSPGLSQWAKHWTTCSILTSLFVICTFVNCISDVQICFKRVIDIFCIALSVFVIVF